MTDDLVVVDLAGDGERRTVIGGLVPDREGLVAVGVAHGHPIADSRQIYRKRSW